MTIFAMECGERGAGTGAGRPEAPDIHAALGVFAAVRRKAVDPAFVDRDEMCGGGAIWEHHRGDYRQKQCSTNQSRR